MKTTITLLAALWTVASIGAEDPFVTGQETNPFKAPLGSSQLSPRIVEVVYAMPEQITKLIFPEKIDEVSVNTQIITVTRNPVESKENYLLLSPKVAKADVNMHVVINGLTYTFRIIVGRDNVNYRKTYTLEGGAATARHLANIPPLAPTEIKTTAIIKMIGQFLRDQNYAKVISKDLGSAPQGRTYIWDSAQVTLQDVWHYYPQDLLVLRVEVYNPSSKAIYLSASQIEPYIANTKLSYLVTEQGTKVLLPGQTDVKYIFLQGYRINIDNAKFELKLPAVGDQLSTN